MKDEHTPRSNPETNAAPADSLVGEEETEVETQSVMLEHMLHQYLHTVLLAAFINRWE
jgi:hypothetical protein